MPFTPSCDELDWVVQLSRVVQPSMVVLVTDSVPGDVAQGFVGYIERGNAQPTPINNKGFVARHSDGGNIALAFGHSR